MTSPRRIVHLDMDAFYASVEIARRPELAGLAIVVGGRGDPNSRGVVTTASYEARKFGVHSGMPLAEAYRRCPHADFLPTDFAEYGRVSQQFKAAILRVTPLIEDRGIDEVYIDATDLASDDDMLAGELKAAVRDATGLSCSIGIAPNKLLAKIASDLKKPDGLTVIGSGDLERRIWPLDVRKIPGIGRVAEARLAQLGITTIGELAGAPIERLRSVFGASYSVFLYEASHGQDDRLVVTEREPKTMSRERTFPKDIGDWATISHMLALLSHQVADDLLEEGYVGRKIGIKLRYADFATHTRETTVSIPTRNAAEIRKAAFACLGRLTLDRRIRLLGVRVGELQRST
ncbi:MAG: DNA polymerase IV [Burkholderiales bacterium]